MLLITMENVTPSTVGEEKRLKGTMNPLSGNDAELARVDADNARKETPGALDMMAGSEFSKPIGSVDMFGPDATPNGHENSRDWTDDVKGGKSGDGEERGEGEGATSKGATNTEDEEESPGAALTSLSNPAYE